MSTAQLAKSAYVRFTRRSGHWLDQIGVISWLKKHEKHSRTAHWLRSLFAIHDIDGLIDLDVPWWTYNAISEIDRFLKTTPNAKVFEFGSGASTVWLARRATSVTSIEHHPEWHAHVAQTLDSIQGLAPVDLRLIEPDGTPPCGEIYLSQKSGEKGLSFETYAREISGKDEQLFDLIVIDGRARAACLKHAITALAPDGVIVFDNSHRRRYRQAIESSGLEARCFRGLTPALPYMDETTILRNRTAATCSDLH